MSLHVFLLIVAVLSWTAFCARRWVFKRKARLFTGDGSQEVLDRYDDHLEIGHWAVINTESGRTLDEGKMYSRTVKYRDTDGSVQLGSDWLDSNEESR